ncbi:MAG: ComEA family DNA-binding protein [Dehalococcoidia bacterium]
MRAWLERHRDLLTAALAAALAIALIFLLLEWRRGPEPLEIHFPDSPPAGSEVQVYVSGAVERPGVYALHEGVRVADAIQAAGGPADDADLEAVNLAQRIHDEDHVTVPRIGEPSSSVAGPGGSPQLIDINTASAALLDTLPGIGEVYSQRIVDSRANEGPFQSTDELLERKLIPRSTYEKIKDLITVR